MAKPTRSMTGARGREPGVGWTDRPADNVVAGTILGGKYRLISEIGRGGMGSVWRAEHVGWDAPVALKLMNRDITAHPEALVRFEREVRLAAGLRSPHVVQVLDHGVDADTGTPFIVMELLEGESLARRLQRSCLSPAEMFDVFSQLVRALSRAHQAGIVHRDLKPDNVFLVRNDEESLAKVLDFGVAKWRSADILESGLTRPGSVVGTPYYMSPEQIQGSREIDHRADLWALAAIACECLTGRRPFEAPDFAQLAVLLLGNVRRPVPSSFGPVPHGFDAWFLRATDPDIERRFQSAREMAQSLAAICDVSPSSGGEIAYPSRPPPSTRTDVPSMAAVSNTAARLQLPTTLWQRPMAKLVGTTIVTTVIMTAVIGGWLVYRRTPERVGATPPSVTISQTSPLAPPKSVGPGVRPILDDAPGDKGVQSPAPGPHISPTHPEVDGTPQGGDFGGGPAGSDSVARTTAEDEARADLARRVRAAQLARGERAQPSKRRHATSGSTSSRHGASPVSRRNDADLIEAPPIFSTPAAPPSTSAPSDTPTTQAPVAPGSKVVDGRVIRTSL